MSTHIETEWRWNFEGVALAARLANRRPGPNHDAPLIRRKFMFITSAHISALISYALQAFCADRNLL